MFVDAFTYCTVPFGTKGDLGGGTGAAPGVGVAPGAPPGAAGIGGGVAACINAWTCLKKSLSLSIFSSSRLAVE